MVAPNVPHRANFCLAGFAHVVSTILAVKSRSAFDADIWVMYDIYLDFVKSCIKLSLEKQLLVQALHEPENEGQETTAEHLPGISPTLNS